MRLEPKWYWISLIILTIIIVVLFIAGPWKFSLLIVAIMNALTSVRFWTDKEDNRHIVYLITAVLFLISFLMDINKP